VAIAVSLALGFSDVVSAATDRELRETQRYLNSTLKYLFEFRGNQSADFIIDTMGPLLFLFIMTLLRSGQRSTLDEAMARISAARKEQSNSSAYHFGFTSAASQMFRAAAAQ
jgi:hypothetical protein